MSVLSLDSATDSADADGSGVTLPSCKKQRVVRFNVGGQTFTTTPQTVSRYPDSLLHRLALEYPETVAAERALFVDRRPDCFPWVLECYRYLRSSTVVLRKTLASGV